MGLRSYLALGKRWLWLLIVGMVVAGGAAFAISRSLTPVYRAATTLLVDQASSVTPYTDYASVVTSQQLAKTYSELIKRRPTLEQALGNLQLSLTPTQLLGQIDVSLIRDTTLIVVTVEDTDPARAAAIANEIGRVFVAQVAQTQRSRFSSSEENLSRQLQQLQSDLSATQRALENARGANSPRADEVARLETALLQYQNSYSTLLRSYEDLRIAEARVSDTVSIAEEAIASTVPVRPQTLLNTLVAALIGLAFAAAVALGFEYLDDTVKRPEDIQVPNLPNLGMIGRLAPENLSDPLVVLRDPRASVAEAFRGLRTNIQFASVDRPLQTLLITSPGPGEGKSVVAANLACALAQSGQRVVLVDADLRHPTVHRLMKAPGRIGLTDALLAENGSLTAMLRATQVDNLRVLATGALPPNPAEMLGAARTRRLIENLKGQFDMVVLDSPPCMAVTDAIVLARQVDGVILVVQAGKTRREAASQAVRSLRQVGANVVGTVLNKLTDTGHSGYYESYYPAGERRPQKQANEPIPGNGSKGPTTRENRSDAAGMGDP